MTTADQGLRIERRFTNEGRDPYENVVWRRRRSRITNPDGSVVFEMKNAEVPANWSAVATDIIVSKYFRKAGVPQVGDNGEPLTDQNGDPVVGSEHSAKDVFDRMAETWRHWGESHGYFASADDAQTFEDELKYMLANQMAAPNSPQWFNTGLAHRYGITGTKQGFWFVDEDTGKVESSPDAYSRPAPHACFIQSVADDLVNDGGIMDLWVREARLFKMGSGTGSNFSSIRAEGEPLAGGGKSSGLMSFLKIGDRAAGAIKSGGTTRRAAKMVTLDMDHPDIAEFISWKHQEEEKARLLIEHGGLPADFNGEAYATVSGQNSNNSVRVDNRFIQAVREDGDWHLINRVDGGIARTVKASELWGRIAEAAWACADPGMQYHSTINEWHTCPEGGEIRASNPCSEYMFLDDTACNLASINLVAFLDNESGKFDVDSYLHAIRLWTIVLEISVTMAHFPSKPIAQGSYDYRTLGLGYANLGSLLMRSGIPYDSDRGRAVAGALTAILTGEAYATSAMMADALGPFPRFGENRTHMLRVIRNHRQAAYGATDYEGVTTRVMAIDPQTCPPDLVSAAREAWDRALSLGKRYGYRNAQATVLAPTGCLVGGSLIPTERGLVRLGSLGDPEGARWQELGAAVGTDDGPRMATHFYVNGAENVVTVNTDRGYRVQGTPTHRIKVVDSQSLDWVWKRFGDIKAGDVVPLQLDQLVGSPRKVTLPPPGRMHRTEDRTTTTPSVMSPELAEFVGYFMGNGSLHAKSLHLRVTAGDFEVLERLQALGKELFNLHPAITEKVGYTEMVLHSVPLTVWWQTCGFAKTALDDGRTGKGRHPHIPDAILASNDPETYRAFVRGLFEADGTVTNGYPTWSTTSIEFGHDIQSLLLAIGYPTTRRIDRSGRGDSPTSILRILDLSDSNGFAEEIGFMSGRKQTALISKTFARDVHHDRIPLSSSMVDRLAPENDTLRRSLSASLDRDGMVSRRSARKLLERTGDRDLSRLLNYFYDRVDSADLGEQQWTYDLSVPDNVTYVANGFVSHNTIGLVMDCDTTGVEPDFALVKFKKLAGGGYFKIANQSLAPSLRRLGYTPVQIQEVLTYVVGTSSLTGAPHINPDTLAECGMIAADLTKVEAALPGAFELGHAFNPFVLGNEAMQRLGFTEDEYAVAGFDMLKELGFTDHQIDRANDAVCGRQTIEGAPHIREEHLPVFDCANRNGKYGRRFIHHTGHIKMLAATQPFISGAISKTINMPNEVSADDVADAYMMSWELGLKAMALYRDGSKASQPLSASSDDGASEETDAEVAAAVEHQVGLAWGRLPEGTSPTQAYANHPRPRFLLPARRVGWTQEARVGGHKVFLRTGEYDDGTLGEIFLDLAKEGATLRGILASFAIAVSKGLQYGVPLEEFVDTFIFQTFEPRGMVEGHPNIKMANSIIDYIFRALGVEYLHRDELVQVPPDRSASDLPEPPKGKAAEAGYQLELMESIKESDIEAQTTAAAFADADTPRRNIGVPKRSPVPVGGNGAKQVDSPSLQATLLDTSQVTGGLMGDAPPCASCGHMTIRNGSCYVCLTCGDTTGCS